MISLVKLEKNKYAWKQSSIVFQGKYMETLAYGHWSFGIPKDQIVKALNLLNNTFLTIFNFE